MEKLLTMQDLCQNLNLCKATIYRFIREDGFPAPLKFGAASRWREVDVQAWIEARSK